MGGSRASTMTRASRRARPTFLAATKSCAWRCPPAARLLREGSRQRVVPACGCIGGARGGAVGMQEFEHESRSTRRRCAARHLQRSVCIPKPSRRLNLHHSLALTDPPPHSHPRTRTLAGPSSLSHTHTHLSHAPLVSPSTVRLRWGRSECCVACAAALVPIPRPLRRGAGATSCTRWSQWARRR